MTVKADSRKRVVLPGASPGDVFSYEEAGDGQFYLIQLNKPEPPRKMTRSEVLAALKKSKLKFEKTWEELRTWTREPFQS